MLEQGKRGKQMGARQCEGSSIMHPENPDASLLFIMPVRRKGEKEKRKRIIQNDSLRPQVIGGSVLFLHIMAIRYARTSTSLCSTIQHGKKQTICFRRF
jgi:hypothetical protein